MLGRKKSSIDDTLNNNFKTEIDSLPNDFAEMFSTQTANIIHYCDIETSINTNIRIENTIFINFTNVIEINQILKSLGERKSAGIDGVRAIDIKNHSDVFAPILCRLINLSIAYAKIPTLMKTAIIKPIYKGGVKNQLNNYRPISILSVLEKCLEGVLVRRLQTFIEKHALIHKSQ